MERKDSDQVATSKSYVYLGDYDDEIQGSLRTIGTIELPPGDKLTEWWLQTTIADINKTVPKAVEYGGSMEGSADLHVMGDNLAVLLGWDQASEQVKQELGVWFYTQGKSARLISNYRHQEPGKSDTWFDITIYSLMARRIQEIGRWP